MWNRSVWNAMHVRFDRSPSRIFLVSYPRSGSHWLRYCLEAITGRPTVGQRDNPRDVPTYLPYPNRFDSRSAYLRYLARQPLLRRVHRVNDIADGDDMVLLVRDPTRAVVRHIEIAFGDGDPANAGTLVDAQWAWYTELVRFAQRHHGRVHILRLEDLQSEPERELTRLLDFLGEPAEPALDRFVANLDWHSRRSLSSTQWAWGGPRTESKLSPAFELALTENIAGRIIGAAVDPALAPVMASYVPPD